jgi:Flp pilus assembly protein TadG
MSSCSRHLRPIRLFRLPCPARAARSARPCEGMPAAPFRNARRRRGEGGQASVEAAFLLPLLFLMLGVFVQPVMLLYDRCVMQTAAAEGCRLYATATAEESALEAYVQRRLRAVPHVDAFHEGGDAGWDVAFSDDGDGKVSVSISHRARPLPLFGITAGLAAQMEGGSAVQETRVESHVVAGWAAQAQGGPADWVGKWA